MLRRMSYLGVCTLVILVTCPTYSWAQGNLLLFGVDNGDSALHVTDDDSSGPLAKTLACPLFGTNETVLYVNANGVISLRKGFDDFNSRPFPLFTDDILIAPFWDDINIEITGQIFYRFSNDSSLLTLFQSYINDSSDFSPVSLFIATWDRVAQLDGDSSVVNTFQAVIATDESRTHVGFIYEDIQWGSSDVTIGFNAGDQSRSYTLPESFSDQAVLNLMNTSNVGRQGTYIFRVDQFFNPDFITAEPQGSELQNSSSFGNLLLFGVDNGDSALSVTDDDSSGPLAKTPACPLFGTNETVLYVNANGVISLRKGFDDFNSRPFPLFTDDILIAPFWDDINIEITGQIVYRFSNDSSLLALFQSYINDSSDFSPVSLFIATWDRVAQLDGDSSVVNTFQAVIATDGRRTYVGFIYGDIQWGSSDVTIGFNSGDQSHSYTLPESFSDQAILNLENTSNVGKPGIYIFRVDQSSNPDLITAEPQGSELQNSTSFDDLLPFGITHGDAIVPPTDDGSSGLLTKDLACPFFGTDEDAIYVNANGVISFRKDFEDYNSKPFPLLTDDILIAPFWEDVDINIAGQIFYRFSNDSSLLSLFQSYINDSSNFSPVSLFIATWDGVAQLDGDTNMVNTFQAVIATDGSRTYVGFIYGDIQWGSSTVTIGFNAGDQSRSYTLPESFSDQAVLNLENTSNIGRQGIYIFRVDQLATSVPQSSTGATFGDTSTSYAATEATSASDATTEAATASDATTEAATASDATTEVPTASDATTEAATASDATTEAATASDATTEAATASDATTEAPIASDATTEAVTTSDVTTEAATTSDAITEAATTADATTEAATTLAATTEAATTSDATTEAAITSDASTEAATTSDATTEAATTSDATTEAATTSDATTEAAITSDSTTEAADATSEAATASDATTEAPTASDATTEAVTTSDVTTEAATTSDAITEAATASDATTDSEAATTSDAITEAATTLAATTEAATTSDATTEAAITSDASTEAATTSDATTEAATTSDATTEAATTSDATTEAAITSDSTTEAADATSEAATTPDATTEAASTSDATSEAVTTSDATSEAATTPDATAEAATTSTEAATTSDATTEAATAATTASEATTVTDATSDATSEPSTASHATTAAATVSDITKDNTDGYKEAGFSSPSAQTLVNTAQGGLSEGAVIGLVVGSIAAAVLVLGIIFLLLCFCLTCRRNIPAYMHKHGGDVMSENIIKEMDEESAEPSDSLKEVNASMKHEEVEESTKVDQNTAL